MVTAIARLGRVLFPDALLSASVRPWRSLATAGGILLAAAGACATTALADTQQAQVDLRFDLQRSAHVLLQAESPPERGFNASALDRIRNLSVVRDVGELSIWAESARVRPGPANPYADLPIVVADAPGLAAAGVIDEVGLKPTTELLDATHRFVWLGSIAGRRFGGTPSTLELNGLIYTVAGTVRAPPGFGYVNTAVILGRGIVPGRGDKVRVVAAVRPGAAAAVGRFSVDALDPTGQLGLKDATPPDGNVLRGSVRHDLRVIGLALSGVICLIGTLGIANAWGVAVRERTREIGLRSALGWTPGAVAALVLIEATISGAFASLVGCAVGLGSTGLWCATKGWHVVMPTWLPVSAVVAGSVASALGGLLPALRAARVSPLVALRS